MDTREWLEKAKTAVADLAPGRRFEAKNLFLEYEWEALSRGDRILFGKTFKAEVLDGRIPGVSYVDRKNNNHSLYIKDNNPIVQ